MRRASGVTLLLAGFLAAAVVGAAPALAHAVAISTDPADGARLSATPAAVSVTFSEHVSFGSGYLRVVDSRGRRVDTGTVQHPGGDATKVAVPLRTGLPDDSYIVSYRIVSADSHPVGGAFSFVVGKRPLVAASGAVVGGTGDPVVVGVFAVARWLSFAGLVLIGGLAFLLLCWHEGRAVSTPRAGYATSRTSRSAPSCPPRRSARCPCHWSCSARGTTSPPARRCRSPASGSSWSGFGPPSST